ncbi:MAG: Do family serine endopeptidase [Aliidongia sp.]
MSETSKGTRGFSRRLRYVGIGAALSVATLPAWAEPSAASADFADLAARLLPAVVNVSTTQNIKADEKPNSDVPDAEPGSPFEEFFKHFRDGHGQAERHPAHKAMALGSGFIIDPAGLVVTNNHVIADADEITVILQDNTKLKAELVGRDVKTDLALLRVKTDHKLSTVAFGDSERERVGDWVLAVGNPFGLGGTVTAGIVSARAREINNNDGIYDDFLQTDAPINRGNSGGPLFNLDGEVIGINTAIFSPSGGSIGIGFAIPSTLARTIVGQLKEYGHTRRGWFGARIESVDDDIAQGLGLDKAKGVLVAGLIDKAPAQQAGIQPGDVLLAIDGREVSDARRFERMIADEPVDQHIKIKVWRKRQERVIDAKIGELDEKDQIQTASIGKSDQKAAPPASVKTLGLLVAEATPELREKFQLNESAAVIVTDVAKGGPAGDRDIKPGDIIVEAAEQEVKHPDDLVKRVEEAKKAGRKSVLLLVDRGGELHFVAIRIGQG